VTKAIVYSAILQRSWSIHSVCSASVEA